jgi:hypothetical protein
LSGDTYRDYELSPLTKNQIIGWLPDYDPERYHSQFYDGRKDTFTQMVSLVSDLIVYFKEDSAQYIERLSLLQKERATRKKIIPVLRDIQRKMDLDKPLGTSLRLTAEIVRGMAEKGWPEDPFSLTLPFLTSRTSSYLDYFFSDLRDSLAWSSVRYQRFSKNNSQKHLS